MQPTATAVFRSSADTLLAQLSAQGDRVVLRHGGADLTGRELQSAIYRHARALATLDIGRGQLVALFAPNCPDALAIRYAVNLLGAAVVLLPLLDDAGRRAAMLARLQPTHVVAFAETAHLVPDTLNATVLYVDTGPAHTRLDTLARAQSAAPVPGRARPDDPGVLASSGGTTGKPKFSCRSFATWAAMTHAPVDPNRRQLINGPLAYLSQVLVDITLIGGGTVVLEPHYDAADTLATIESERITDLFLVEPQLFDLMDHRDVATRDLSSLRSLAHVGGSVPEVLWARAHARLGPVLVHTYGASEMGVVSVHGARESMAMPGLPAIAGRVLPGVEVRVRRADGSLAAEGQCGNIEVRSASVAAGYRNQPEEQAQKFHDGWCLTGDSGFIDGDGYLHVLGRSSEVVDVDGRAIGPAHIEDVLCRLPGVRFAVAFATSGAAKAPAWRVVIESHAGSQVDLASCVAALHEQFGPSVSAGLRIAEVERVPLTDQGKADRVTIESLLDAMR